MVSVTPLHSSASSGFAARHPAAFGAAAPTMSLASQQQTPAMNAKFAALKQDQVDFKAREHTANPLRAAYFAGANAHALRPGEGIKQLNKTDQLANHSRDNSGKTLKAIGSGLAWGAGATLGTAILGSMVAIPAAIIGFVPLMHWLWPIALFSVTTGPLLVGGAVGAMRGLHIAMKK
jgi:hypothetical protein